MAENGIDTFIYAIKQTLDNLPKEKESIILSGVTLGKRIKGYPLRSRKYTLTQQEITLFTKQLIQATKAWSDKGHDDWIVIEVPGIRFTVKFIRKGTERHIRTLSEIYKVKPDE